MSVSKKDKLYSYINGIAKTNAETKKEAQALLDSLIKPPKSLGALENIASQISSITGEVCNDIDKRAVIIMCADNGVVCEGVASAPQSVTLFQTLNFALGVTGVGVLAKKFNTDLIIVDVGVDGEVKHEKIIDRKIRKSTENILQKPAMTYDEALDAMLVGIEMAELAKEKGYKAVGLGEMGIGNTTTSSAVLSVITGVDVNILTGRGAGLSDENLKHKIDVIEKSIEKHKPNKEDAIDIVSKVGGLDIAAMAGAYIGAAYHKMPVVVDGFISIVSACLAAKLNPVAKEYMITSHHSAEPGYCHAADYLGMKAPLMLDMRLGEGSGCPLMFAVIDGALYAMKNMATFESAKMEMGDYLEKLK